MKRGLLILLIVSTTQISNAVTIAGYNAANFDRFSSGYSSSPVPNASPAFIGAGYNFSGVGWNPSLPTQSFAMISDQYFVYANHYAPGSSISFYSPISSSVVTYGVSAASFEPVSPITGRPSDLRIGKLTTPLNSSDGIAHYPVLNLSTYAAYLNLPVLIYGHGPTTSDSPRIGVNKIDSFYSVDLNNDGFDDSIDFGYKSYGGAAGEAMLEGGDSGSPSFVSWFGQLALVGTHSATGSVNSVDYSFDNFIPSYLDQIFSAGIDFETVPEPSRALLVVIGLVPLIWNRQRKTRFITDSAAQ